MRRTFKFAVLAVALLVLLGACTGLPGATAPVETVPTATAAPAATEAPGSTEAAPAAAASPVTTAGAERGASPSPEATQASAEPTRAPTEPAPTSAPAPTAVVAAVPTEAPEPTLPPAPTESAPAIACTPGALTPAQTEGPYYSENPPETSDLLQPGMGGTKLSLTGYVLDEQCQPVPGARVDFWQADAEGQYDNQGYTLRGYQVTDAQGRYSVETVIPGLYPGRTRHIHVKVTPPGGATLITQLYFPEEAANTSDRIFSPELIVNLEKAGEGETGTFNFVVRAQ